MGISLTFISFLFGQKKLIMVGSCKTLSKVPLLKLLIKKVDEQSGILRISKKEISYREELKRCSQLR
jgi:DNA replication ATP-dependent helicase Dna2